MIVFENEIVFLVVMGGVKTKYEDREVNTIKLNRQYKKTLLRT